MTDKRKRTGDKDFGLRLRRCREALELTQEQLAGRSGVAQNTISGYETGSVMPESKDLRRLARAVGAKIELLLEGVPGMPNEVEKFLLALPKRTWRKIIKMSPQELEQAGREIAALIEAKPTKRPAGKPRPR